MTKLTEAANEEECNHFGNPNSFKSGWLAALEEVAKEIDGAKANTWVVGTFDEGRESLRAEILKVIEGLKK